MDAKNFYLEHVDKVPSESLDVNADARALRTPGQRYFAIYDSIEKMNELSALERGFGRFPWRAP